MFCRVAKVQYLIAYIYISWFFRWLAYIIVCAQLCFHTTFCNRICRLPLFVHRSSQKPHFPILRSCCRPFLAKQTRPPLHPSIQEAVLVSACPLAGAGDLRPSSGGAVWEMTVRPSTAPLSSQYPQAGLEAVLR